MKDRLSKICVICGQKPATTRDNVPPEAVFPKPRPSDLIRVPACTDCNCGSSLLDESFKVFTAIAAGYGPEGEKMFR